MALAALCTDTDVRARLANPGLAVVDTEESVITEAIDRKIVIAHAQLELAMLARIQRAISPNQTYDNKTPAEILALLTDASKVLMKTCAVEWVLYYLFEEGESTLRFKYEDAGDVISKKMDRLQREKNAALDVVWPLINFNIDGVSTVSDLERGFTNKLSSVRVSF
jgi:hypothetical protein